MHCAQTAKDIDTISFNSPRLSQIVLKFNLHRPTLLRIPLQILPQSDLSPVDLSVGDIRRQIIKNYKDGAMLTVELLHAHYFEWYHC